MNQKSEVVRHRKISILSYIALALLNTYMCVAGRGIHAIPFSSRHPVNQARRPYVLKHYYMYSSFAYRSDHNNSMTMKKHGIDDLRLE